MRIAEVPTLAAAVTLAATAHLAHADPPAGVTIYDVGITAHDPLGYSDWNTALTMDGDGNAYVAFVDADRKNTVAKVTPAGTITSQIIDTGNNANDPGHNTPSIVIDGDGILHVAYDMHNDNMTLRRSPAAHSVTGTWTDEGGTGSPWGSSVFTYPATSAAPNGDAYLAIRNGGHGGAANLFHYDDSTNTWADRGKFAEESGFTAYLPAPYVDPSGKVHLSVHWREGGAGTERQLGTYAMYDPADDTYYKADGTAYTAAITTATADLYQPSEADWGNPGISDTSLTVTDQDRPILAYNFFRNGQSDERVVRIARWDGTQWLHTDLAGPATGITLGDPVIVNRGGDIHVFYRDETGKLLLQTSEDHGASFADAITLTDHEVRAPHLHMGHLADVEQEAIFFIDPTDGDKTKVMFVNYDQVPEPAAAALLGIATPLLVCR